MAGRGALIKPWLFQEWATGRAAEPDAADRIGIYRRLVGHMKAHFGDDARGRAKAWYFLPWHFDFFVRYRCGSSLQSPRVLGVWAHGGRAGGIRCDECQAASADARLKLVMLGRRVQAQGQKLPTDVISAE